MLWYWRFSVLVTLATILTCVPLGFSIALPNLSNGDVSPSNTTAFRRNPSTLQTNAHGKHKRNGGEESVAADLGTIHTASFDLSDNGDLNQQYGDLNYKYGELNDKHGDLNNKHHKHNINGKKVLLSRMVTTSTGRPWERKFLVTSEEKQTLGILRVIYLDEAPSGSKVARKVKQLKTILQLLEPDMFLWDEYKEGDAGTVYMVLMKNMHGTVRIGDDTNSVTLKPLTEWRLEENWDEETMLPLCLQTAIKEHEMLLEKNVVIDNYRLSEWVADKNCKYWLPMDVPLGFDKLKLKGARLLIDRRGKVKEKQKKDYEATYRDDLAPFFQRRV